MNRRPLDRIARDWQQLGTIDPLWAVYVAPGTERGGWNIGEFFATGCSEADRVFSELAGIGRPTARRIALDFGCGVGRLSQPLADRFDRVLAVDVSPAMLKRAAELDRSGGRIEFILNHEAHLGCVASASVDLVYSSLVLQHLVRPLAAKYLAEFIRILAPGGVAVVQLATRPTASLKGWADRLLPAPIIGWIQTHVLAYPAPMRMEAMPTSWVRAQVAVASGRIIAQAEDSSYGGHWIYTRYFIASD
jgi:SAM-dependent methyltransferase